MKYSSKLSSSKFKVPTAPSSLSKKDYSGAYQGLTKPNSKVGKTFAKAPMGLK